VETALCDMVLTEWIHKSGFRTRCLKVCLLLRYDEWVKADRLIWPVEKGTKKRRRKKVS